MLRRRHERNNMPMIIMIPPTARPRPPLDIVDNPLTKPLLTRKYLLRVGNKCVSKHDCNTGSGHFLVI